jgi:transposase InsO family protein
MLHDLGATGAGIPIQALPMTHLISITYVFKISSRSFSDFRVLSYLQDTANIHCPHFHRTSLCIYLYVKAHPLTASPRHPYTIITMLVTRQPNLIFSDGPETFSSGHEMDEMRSVFQQ